MKALFSAGNDFPPSELHGRNMEDTEKTLRRNHILEKLQHLQCSGLISCNRKGEKQNSVKETKLQSRYLAPKMGPGKSDPVRKEGPHNNADSLGKVLAECWTSPVWRLQPQGCRSPPPSPGHCTSCSLTPPGDPLGRKGAPEGPKIPDWHSQSIFPGMENTELPLQGLCPVSKEVSL